MKHLLVFALIVLASCTKQAKQPFAHENQSRKSKTEVIQTTLGTTATITLSNNGNGTFNVDYGGATDVVWVFFRAGNELHTNGNLIPLIGQSYYLNPITTIEARITGTYYQVVVVTGSTERDANGILGADWVNNFSNVVQ